jgi:hypothetical protein
VGEACCLSFQPDWAPSEIYESLRRAEFRRDETEVFFLSRSSFDPGSRKRARGMMVRKWEIADP